MHYLVLPEFPERAEVIAISPHEWRVSDPSKAEHDGLSLVGFVQQVGDSYEVTALGDPKHRRRAASLAEAVTLLVDSAA